jgi:hypothetical protein
VSWRIDLVEGTSIAVRSLSAHRLRTVLTTVGVGIGVATLLAILGMACLLGAAAAMGREVSMAVHSLDAELDAALAKRRRGG